MDSVDGFVRPELELVPTGRPQDDGIVLQRIHVEGAARVEARCLVNPTACDGDEPV